MRSFLLSYRLKQLSRDITKQTFSDTTERVDAEALKKHPLSRHRQKRILCGIAVACVVTLLVGSLILQPILAENLKNVNIY